MYNMALAMRTVDLFKPWVLFTPVRLCQTQRAWYMHSLCAMDLDDIVCSMDLEDRVCAFCLELGCAHAI
jgi:hypothetical protein